MALAVVLCPWVMPIASFGEELPPRALSQVSFEFESSASAEE